MPERTCVVCRKKGEPSVFFRMVVGPEGSVVCELGSALPGRGARCCFDARCVGGLARSNRLEKALRKKRFRLDEDELLRNARTLLARNIEGMLSASRGKGVLALGREAAVREMKLSNPGKAFVSRDISPKNLANLKRVAEEVYSLPFDMEELGGLFRRKPVGVLFVGDSLLADGIRLRAMQEEAMRAG